MTLRKIKVHGFRNLADTELEFSDEFNFIIGENGAGKTNLLEAIFYVCLASSFRVKDEKHLIRANYEYLRVNAEADGKSAQIFLDKDNKRLMLQENEVHRLSDYVGWLGVTLLSIDDIWLVRGSPSMRRSYLDWTIAKISTRYLSDLIEYRKILRQRNKTLQMVNETGDFELLAIFDNQMIDKGNELYAAREAHLPEIRKHMTDIGEKLGLKALDFDYWSTCPGMRIDHQILSGARQKELAIGHTTVGPHRDDLLLRLNGYRLQNFASEGEERVAAISMKLTEAHMVNEKTGTQPILLLDEVAAELDLVKRNSLLELIDGQIFYASTVLPQFAKTSNKPYRIFSTKRGIFEVSSKN
jgi:DNA replication and repair protein RecF